MGRQELGGEISVLEAHGKVPGSAKSLEPELKNINLCQYLFMTKRKKLSKLEIIFLSI